MASTSTLPQSTPLPTPVAGLRALVRWEWLAALLITIVVFTAVQAATYNIIGIDGQYHIRVGALIREAGWSGPRLDFPWLHFTILDQAGYTDHHLLFHMLQAPFTVLDLRLAAKASALVFAVVCFWGCYLFMARNGVRWPLAWLVVLLAVAHTFLWRQSMSRPQSLALLLLVAALWLIFERRYLWLVPVGFVSAWLFDGFVLTLAVPMAACAARLADGRLDLRPLALLTLGTLLGVIAHPYFPNNFIFAALHLLPKGGLIDQEQVRVGSEWYPYSRSGFITRVGPSVAVMLVGLIPILSRLWRREPVRFPVLTLLFLAMGFLAMQVRSQRMIEYFPAFAVLLAAFSWSRPGVPVPTRLEAPLARWGPKLMATIVPVVLGAWLIFSIGQAQRDARAVSAAAKIESYQDAAVWLSTNSPPGSLVFNTDWDDFPQLFYWDTNNVYVVGLDPTYMSLYDPDLYRLWRTITIGGQRAPSAMIRDYFGAQYVFTDVLHNSFLTVAAQDPGLEEVFRSPAAVVFRVK
jgi:hypothetical protein